MDATKMREELIRMRKAAGLSQAALATRLGCTPSRVSGVEVGRLGVGPDDVEAWAAACGFEVVLQFLPAHTSNEARALAQRIGELPEEHRKAITDMLRLLAR